MLSLACGPLGVWVLLYRRSYAAESLSHGMLPGLVIAALAARRCARRGGGVIVCAVAISLAGRDERRAGRQRRPGRDRPVRRRRDPRLSPTPPRLNELLFGDLLGVNTADLAVAAALAGGVALALAARTAR